MKLRVSFAVGRRLTALGFLAVLVLVSWGWFPWMTGSLTGTRVLEVVYFADPLATLEMALASGTLPASAVTGAALLLAATLLLGPVFCGWLCPLGLALDLNQWLRRVVLRRTPAPAHTTASPRPSAVRYAVLGAALGFSLVAGWSLFQALSPIQWTLWCVALGLWPVAVLLGVLALVEWRWPRLWCRSLCPLGGLYSALGARAPLRVRLDQRNAGRTPCQRCTRSCPMGIPVMEDFSVAGKASIDRADCTRCGACIDVCPRGVLRIGFRKTPPIITPLSTEEPSPEACDETCDQGRTYTGLESTHGRSSR